MPTVTIEVTAAHLAVGRRYSPTLNPVAIAFHLATRIPVMVNTRAITFKHPVRVEVKAMVWTPPDVVRRLVDFNRGEALDPFTFTLDLPEEFRDAL